MTGFRFEDEPYDGARATALVGELLGFLNERYGPGDFRSMGPAEFVAPDGAFVVVLLGDQAVACGGFLRADGETAELKRMYVRPSSRGQGLARRLLRHLEGRARGLGYQRLRLETGVLQPEAIARDRSEGYREVERWAPYEEDEVSVCFAKDLAAAPSAT